MFKKIYYINLEHRNDRREHVENEIKKINFKGPIERINAAYGKNLDLSLIPSNLFTKKAIKTTTDISQLFNMTTMTKGGMGVALSHKWIYEKTLTGIEDYVLILEDDITIVDNFMEKLEAILKDMPKFDIFYLGYHNKVDKISVFNKHSDVPSKIWGLFGYIINKKAAKRLIEVFPLTKQIDTDIPKCFNDLDVYALHINKRIILSPTSQESFKFGSDIQFSRESFDNIDGDICQHFMSFIYFVIFIVIVYIIYKYQLNKKTSLLN
jgi:GR25 family glycosyltransferase involved in LPS biosynthesis